MPPMPPMPMTPPPPLPESEIVGVVLAGGHSQRMGAPKPALLIGGEPLLRRVVARVGAALAVVVIVGPAVGSAELAELAALVPGARLLPDLVADQGPLGGLVTALVALPAPRIFLVACDMPFVRPALVRAMAASAARAPASAVLALRTDEGLEPLHAVYARSCLPAAQQQLEAGERSLRSLLRLLAVREVAPAEVAAADPRGLSAFNANTRAHWARAQELAAQGL